MKYLMLSLILILGVASASPAVRPPRGPLSPGGDLAVSGAVDILVIRVEFPVDADGATTGDGRFVVREIADSLEAPFIYDYYVLFGKAEKESPFVLADGSPAFPYYDMDEYFTEISCGAFSIGEVVFTDIYTAPDVMSYYGSNEDEESGICGLIDFALQAASAGHVLTSYDIICLLHAGAGEEFDVRGDSPSDILSSAVTRGEYLRITGGDMDPGALNGVMVIPEYETQDKDSSEMPFCLLGPAAFTLGRLIGMPYTYDVSMDSTGVGMWDLMGYGFWNYLGFLPMHPSGYVKWRMGWADPVRADSVAQLTLQPFAADVKDTDPDGNNIYIKESGDGEYFLIESRTRRGIEKYFQQLLFLEAYEEEGSIKYLMGPGDQRDMGVLIWHWDSKLTACHPEALNGPWGKGLDVEEADGLEDLDRSIGGKGSFGEVDDMFSEGTWRRFNEDTAPSSADNSGGVTGVSMEVVSSLPGDMRIAFYDGRPAGFPVAYAQGNLMTAAARYENGAVVNNSDGTVLYDAGEDDALMLTDDLFFTSGGVYSTADFSLLEDADVLLGETLTSAEAHGDGFFVRGSSASARLDASLAAVEYYGGEVVCALPWRGGVVTLDDAGVIEWNGSVIAEYTEELTLYGEELLYNASGGTEYFDGVSARYVTDRFTGAVQPSDYDGDGVTEIGGICDGDLVAVNIGGALEGHWRPGTASHVEAVRIGGRLAYFVTGSGTYLVYPGSKELLQLTGKDTVFETVSGGYLIYRDAQRVYGYGGAVEPLRVGRVVKRDMAFDAISRDRSYYCYPNPCAGNRLTVRLYSDAATAVSYTVFDGSGARKLSGKSDMLSGEDTFDIDVSALDDGVYMLAVRHQGEYKRMKFIKI